MDNVLEKYIKSEKKIDMLSFEFDISCLFLHSTFVFIMNATKIHSRLIHNL